nr:MAG TPA: hypothetical protein [Caudoviricetes sp.]
MTEQKINKSDYTDSNNKVWGSVGENIRKGSKNLKTTFDNLDENELQKLPVMPIKGHWEYIVDTVDSSLLHSFSNYSINSTERYAELQCKIYSIIIVNSDNTEPAQSICLPFINGDTTYVEFLANATIECVNEFLIYIGDE